MKILIISAEFPPQIGGAGSFISDFAVDLAANGHTIDLITRKFPGQEFTRKNSNLKIHYVKNIKKVFIILLWLKTKLIYNDSYDYIILNDVGASFVASLFFNKKMKSKSICFLHGQETSDTINKKYTWYEKLLSLKEKYFNLLKDCRLIIAVSDDLKNKIIEACADKIDLSKKIKILNCGYDPSQFYFEKGFTSHFKQDTFNIITVSRIVKLKGYDLMFEVLSKLKEQNFKFHWYIIGDGNYKVEFEQKIINSSLKNYTTFLGRKNRNVLREYYSAADVYLLLSMYREAFPIVYMEAIACGCPAIGLDYGGVREIIEDDTNGFLVPNIDQVSIIQFTVEKLLSIRIRNFNRTHIASTVVKFQSTETYRNFMSIISV